MNKDEVDSAITVLEAWGRFEDNWVIICAAGVALFLALEVVFSVAHWRNERALRPLRTEQSRLHSIELAELGRTAEEAKEETARLSAEADMAKAEIAKANKAAAEANERAVRVQTDNTQLEIRLEEERKNRIALQNALATPHLTPEQIDQLVQTVRGRVPSWSYNLPATPHLLR